MTKRPWNVFTKIRSALRDIYRFSPMRRAAIDTVKQKDSELGGWGFECVICRRQYHIKMAQVDHISPVGSLVCFEDLEGFARRLFTGPTRVICLICHAKVTKEQRRAKR